jgi:hypothetical protein
VNIFIEHDSQTLAQLSGAAAPNCDGVILQHGQPDIVLASTIRSNPLSEHWLYDLDLPGSRLVTWSGTVADGLFERTPLNWMPQGQRAFNQFCDQLQPQLVQHDRRLCFHPHSRHVLSDVNLCMKFLRERADESLQLALAPSSLLEPSMMADVEDHLTRMFEALGPVCAMVFLNDVVVAETDGDTSCEMVPLGQGILPRKSVLGLMHKHVPAATPIVIGSKGIPAQIEWLNES